MNADREAPPHPGEVLRDEFLYRHGITQTALAEHLDISLQRVNELVNGKRGVTPDTAWLLGMAFETGPEYWMELQARHDLSREKPDREVSPIT